MTIPKNALKTVIFLLQIDFTGDFITDCLFGSSIFDTTFLPDYTKFCSVFSDYWIGNLMRIPKMCLKQLFFYFKWILQAILSLTVFLNCLFGSSIFDTTFLPDCTKFCSVFSDYWIGNLMRIPKMCFKLSFSHSICILTLTFLSTDLFDSLCFDTAFLPDFT